MKQILFVSENRGYMTRGFITWFEDAGFKVVETGVNADEINVIQPEYCAILLYGDDELLKHRNETEYLAKFALRNDIRFYATGSSGELDFIRSCAPGGAISGEFLRPVNITEIVDSIIDDLRKAFEEARKQILIVDDSGFVLRNMKEWLTPRYQVAMANSVAMAFKFLNTTRPDLIILDYEMPVCDGRQFLGMLRAEPEYMNIPVIFLTNKADRESIMGIMSMHPEGYLLKSMEPRQVVAAIDEFFISG